MGQFTTEIVGSDIFLDYVLDETEQLDRLACGMMDNNRISGLLPMNRSQFDNTIRVRYCISRMSKFKDYMEKNNNGHLLLLRLKKIADIAEKISAYMLEERMCVYDPEHIYIDEEGNPSLIYLPVEQAERKSGFYELCEIVIAARVVICDTQYSGYEQLKQCVKDRKLSIREFAELLDTVELNSAVFVNDTLGARWPSAEGGLILGEEQRVEREPLKEKPLVTEGPIILSRGQALEDGERGTKTVLDTGSQDFHNAEGPVILQRKEINAEARFNDTVFFDSFSDTEENTIYLKKGSRDQRTAPYLISRKDGGTIPITGRNLRIGRDPLCSDYVISENRYIGHSHCHILERDGEYFIVDDNSKNHTYVDGMMIPSGMEVRLRHGQTLRLANVEFEFRMC